MDSSQYTRLKTNLACTHLFNDVVNGKFLSEMSMDCVPIKIEESDTLPYHIYNESEIKLHEEHNLVVTKKEPCIKCECIELSRITTKNEVIVLGAPAELLADTINGTPPINSNDETVLRANFNCNKDYVYQGKSDNSEQFSDEFTSIGSTMNSSLCRTCLGTNLACTHLFNNVVNGKSLSEMLMDCVPMKIEESDTLPYHICNECTKKLISAWTFRELVQESEIKLREKYNLVVTKKEPCIKSEHIGLSNITTQNEIELRAPVELLTDSISGTPPINSNDEGMLVSANFDCNKNNACQEKCNNTEKFSDEFSLIDDTMDAQQEQPGRIEKRNCKKQNAHSEKLEALTQPSSYCSLEISNRNLKNNQNTSSISENKDDLTKSPKNGNVLCKDCNKSFSYDYYNRIHIHSHTGNNPYICNICEKPFSNVYQLNKHKSEHQDVPYSCYVCGEHFETFSKMQTHRGTHKYNESTNVDQQWVCDICGKHFKSVRSLHFHRVLHTNNKPQHCSICKKDFMNEKVLTKHVLIVHSEGFLCELCGKSFPKIQYLNKHKTSHDTERTVPCPTCGKLFPNDTKLKYHMQWHTEKRPHACEYCNKTFKTTTSKKTHILVHTGEKPLACKICGKRFARSSTIGNHMLTHTGETPFVCEKCPYKCKYKQQFDRHLRRHK